MSHIRVIVCRVDDPASDQMTELAAFDLPTTDVSALQPETALDALEAGCVRTRYLSPRVKIIVPRSGRFISVFRCRVGDRALVVRPLATRVGSIKSANPP